MLNQYSDVLSITDVCNILKIGRNRAYELLKTERLHGFQLGRVWKIPKVSLEEYLKQQSKLSE
jgi:excisionase family DNA binding protein